MNDSGRKRILPHVSLAAADYITFLSSSGKEPTIEQLRKKYVPNINQTLVKDTESLFCASICLGIDHADSSIELADPDTSDIPELQFNEAISFLKARIPLTKAEWNKIEPEVRFRAFTVARLAQCDYIEAVRGRLLHALKNGEGYADAWKDIQAIAREDGTYDWKPGYWENVFRTNTQTCYTAGHLMQYQKHTPPAYELFIINDGRTSDICRSLLAEGKNGLVLSADHSFWKTYGFPPYHYQCRTSIRAVYEAEIKDGLKVENPSEKTLKKKFHPLKGFGGNPVETESFWKITDKMIARARRYGIEGDIDSFAREIGIEDVFKMRNIIRQDSYSYIKTGDDSGFYVASGRRPRNKQQEQVFQKEQDMVSLLSKKGHDVYMIPERSSSGVPNVDTIVDGKFVELKEITGSIKKVGMRFNESRKQGNNVFLKIDSDLKPEDVRFKIAGELKQRPGNAGLIMCYFTQQDKWYYWSVSDLN